MNRSRASKEEAKESKSRFCLLLYAKVGDPLHREASASLPILSRSMCTIFCQQVHLLEQSALSTNNFLFNSREDEKDLLFVNCSIIDGRDSLLATGCYAS